MTADQAPNRARLLRQLRLRQWPDVKVRQPRSAHALNVSVPPISSWEDEGSPRAPPVSAWRLTRVANPWQFGDGKQLVIVCARLPEDLLARVPYVDPDDPHHIALYTYADLDALFELHGHIRALNPTSEIRRHTPDELEPDDLTSHLVLLGGVAWNDLTTNVFEGLDLPVESRSTTGTASRGPTSRVGASASTPNLRAVSRPS